jgi:diguanylate cyclase (GGDEF)-like protein/PAS domain S-box-containing protein
MTLPGRDTAPNDRLTQGVAYGRIVIGVALALFPFGWAGSTPAQYAIILALAGAVVGIGILQLLRPQMACVPRLAAKLDAPISIAAMAAYPDDPNRLLFGLVMISMLEAAAVLRGGWLLTVWLVDIVGYAGLEAHHPAGDGVSIIVRIVLATTLAVGVHVAIGRFDAERQRFARLSADLQAVIWEIDPSGVLTYVNDHAQRLFGRVEDIAELFQLPDDSFVTRLFADGRADLQVQVHTLDGHELWLHLTGSVSHDRRGRPVSARGVAHDITDIRQAEQRFRSLAEHAPIGIFRSTPGGLITYVNPRVYQIAGISPDDLDESGWIAHVHPDDREMVEEVWQSAAGRPRPFHLACRMVRPTGEVRSIVQLAVPVWDGHGRLVGFEGTCDDVTERLAAERALRESEQRLRDVFDNVDLLATITDAEGRIVYINHALAAASGRTPGELIGHDWIETLSADADADVVEHFYSELRAGRIVRQDENSIETPDGRVRLVAWSNTILRNADGSIFGAASIGQDITERRTAEANLRASEERFRTLSQHAPVGIFQTDAAGGCTYVNERWSQMAGMTTEHAAGGGWAASIHPDDRERVSADWRAAREAGEQYSGEFRFQRPDGSIVWAHAIGVPVRDWDGAVTGYIGTCADITERRQAEEAVIESERRLRTITDNMTDVIFVYGMDRRLVWATPSVERLTGYTVAELFERNTLDDVHPADAPRMLEVWRALFDGQGYTGAEFRIINRDGTEKWCWSAGNPLYDEDGVQIGVQIRDADISLRKQAELRLRESEHRSRAIIETTSDAFLSADGNGVIQEWNRAAEQIFGVPRAEAVGANVFELVLTESGREILERGLGSLGTEGEATVELVARNAARGDFAAEMRLWPMLVDGSLTLNAFVRDITERKRHEEQVTFMAYHDPLTGLPNRAMLEQHLELVLVRARHDASAAALLYLDIDRFKSVNDTFGHEAGDVFLCDVAARLRSAARAGDLVVRLGGDEFVIVLGDLPAEGAADVASSVAERVHDGLSQAFDVSGTSFQTSASVGIALFPDDGSDPTSLLTAADTGMYASKRAGRGRTSFPLGSRRAA